MAGWPDGRDGAVPEWNGDVSVHGVWRVGRRCYHLQMTVRKLSIALDNGTATAVQAAAERRGVSVSSWLNEAAEHALRIEDGLRGVAEWEAEHGALTTAELAAADRFLTRKARRRAS